MREDPVLPAPLQGPAAGPVPGLGPSQGPAASLRAVGGEGSFSEG